MIPRETLKKIRQIELRTNRLVTTFAAGARLCEPQHSRIAKSRRSSGHVLSGESAAGRRPALRLFQPPPQFLGVARAVKDRNDADEMQFNGEIDAVTFKDFDSCFPNGFVGEEKSFRVLKDAGKGCVNFGFKPVTQTRLLFVIPEDGIFKFQPRLRLKDYLAGHARRAARRSLSSARTCSHGIPVSGLRRSRSARRSNSASCSGDGSAANLARKTSKTSRCSSRGSLRNSSTTSATLMATIYSFQFATQASFSARADSSFIIHHSSFPPA